MFAWLKKNWLPLAIGTAGGAVGLMVYEKRAAAMAPALPPASTSAQVGLQPGATTVSVSKNGSVLLTLPTGASWATSGHAITPLNPTAVQPTGSIAFNVTMSAQTGVFPLTANWVDSSGVAKSTTINIAVS
jgi:hypothetical protein